ncbi:hypothetical protein II5_05997 [Bacillus cereus MSX-A1]|uniref:ADP-ribosyltransferase n=1 Tax=Bacillus cereus TaxID=1396 RepID=UPI0002795407|nr:ADP-ribosyltransferase [Bacillus cereus]EJQ97267.1 hypothetical protein II5_05997 [Bacillus cereus MSX-A1]MDR4292616.1 ADP ribosyltransferase [Bacillus cereus]
MILKNQKVVHACMIGASVVSLFTVPSGTSAETTMTQQCHATSPLHFHSECKIEAMDWGNNLFNLWDKLTPRIEKDIIRGYTAANYQTINGYLRSEYFNPLDQEKVERSVKLMDRAFSRVRLQEDMIVYRRVSERSFGLKSGEFGELMNEESRINMSAFETFKRLFQGKYKKDPTYISTSIVKDAAESFSHLPILMKIHIPKGVPAIYVAPLSHLPEEDELLLPRNRTYKVTNILPVIEEDREYIMLDIEILDIASNYRNKRSNDIVYDDNLPSLSK